ncbi:hypothetical protein FB451DRAFT_1294634 [Mycena latifolia]|nr:hypothetical protein FB451DRAFT_1294634 [Mycena latifolia]
MDFVPTSQPWQDGEDDLWRRSYSPAPDQPTPQLFEASRCTAVTTTESLSDLDVVGSSQPFEDGEYDLHYHAGLKIPSSPPHSPGSSKILAHRTRLVRRASPVKPRPTAAGTSGTISRPRNLVRRVTMAAEIARRRMRARTEAHRILKKLRALATATARLRRKHKALCAFVLESSITTNQEVMYQVD